MTVSSRRAAHGSVVVALLLLDLVVLCWWGMILSVSGGFGQETDYEAIAEAERATALVCGSVWAATALPAAKRRDARVVWVQTLALGGGLLVLLTDRLLGPVIRLVAHVW